MTRKVCALQKNGGCRAFVGHAPPRREKPKNMPKVGHVGHGRGTKTKKSRKTAGIAESALTIKLSQQGKLPPKNRRVVFTFIAVGGKISKIDSLIG